MKQEKGVSYKGVARWIVVSLSLGCNYKFGVQTEGRHQGHLNIHMKVNKLISQDV